MLIENLVCPRCHHSLTAGPTEWQCTSCNSTFPLCDENVPVLVASNPDVTIARGYYWLYAKRKELAKKIRQLEAEEWGRGGWNAQRGRLIDAYTHNRAFLGKLESQLACKVSPEAICEVIKDTQDRVDYFDFFELLERDWSFEGDHEELVRIIKVSLCTALDHVGACEGPLVILGAGMGRFAVDLAKQFHPVWAFDISVTMALAFRLLNLEGINCYYVDLRDSETATEQVRHVHLPSPQSSLTGAALATGSKYIVADAAALPLPASSASVICSIYFSDVIRLPDLLLEARRVLKTGGILAHFGPLHYHFDNERDMLPVEEIRTLLTQFGFEIVYERWIDTRHRRTPKHMLSHSYRCWCFLARKQDDTGLTSSSVLRLLSGTVIQTIMQIGSDGVRSIKHTLISPLEYTINITEDELILLNQFDGTIQLESAFEKLRKHQIFTNDRKRELILLLHRLLKLGAVGVGLESVY